LIINILYSLAYFFYDVLNIIVINKLMKNGMKYAK